MSRAESARNSTGSRIKRLPARHKTRVPEVVLDRKRKPTNALDRRFLKISLASFSTQGFRDLPRLRQYSRLLCIFRSLA